MYIYGIHFNTILINMVYLEYYHIQHLHNVIYSMSQNNSVIFNVTWCCMRCNGRAVRW